MHNPPGDNNALHEQPTAPAELKAEELHLASTDPEVNQYVLIAMLIITIAIMAATAEWVSIWNAESCAILITVN